MFPTVTRKAIKIDTTGAALKDVKAMGPFVGIDAPHVKQTMLG